MIWAASSCLSQALPASSPVPPSPGDVYTCKSVTVFLKPLFPWLFSMTASFTWGTEKLWQLLNIELQEVLLLRLQNFTLSRVQILLETNFHFEDQFRRSYFKPMSTLFTRRCPAEQEEFVFWKTQIRLIRLSLRLSPASDFYLLTKLTSSTRGSFCSQLN